MKVRRSIMTTDFDHCYLCGAPAECVHHIFFGPNRKISEREGFIVPLCNRCHNLSEEAVHFNHFKDRKLKMMCQAEYERTHSHGEFMRLIGRNYL